ncbi:MAG: glutamate-5-semialdehyde dehydrogenase [Eubacteriales bacterium]
MEHVRKQAEAAKKASYDLGLLSTDAKNAILHAMADALEADSAYILSENQKDVDAARAAGRTDALIDRLALSEARIKGMADGLRQVAALDDPIGEGLGTVKRPNGLEITKKRVPLGVVGIIYEARPNVTADAMGLCIKTGNAVVLRGGSEAFASNSAVTKIAVTAGEKAGLPKGGVQLLQDVSREAATYMMTLNGLISVLIPRGGAGLIQSVVKNATIPTIETGTGNCHVYIDDTADLDMGVDILFNGKTQRPAVCNAVESLLVAESIAQDFLPMAYKKLSEKNVEFRGCEKTCEILKEAVLATDEDYYTEFLDYILSVKVVKGVFEAIDHINKYGTMHSETIVTNSYDHSKLFFDRVDAAAVYTNASTRFTDGEMFGFGAEIGISTQKLHARGPMGLKELTTVKYVIEGSGQIR